MNADKFARLFVSELDFEEDSRQLINRKFPIFHLLSLLQITRLSDVCVKTLFWFKTDESNFFNSAFSKLIYINFVQLENIFNISTTCDVLKLAKFNEYNEKELQNISLVFVTLDVSKYDKSREVKEQQW